MTIAAWTLSANAGQRQQPGPRQRQQPGPRPHWDFALILFDFNHINRDLMP
jgi:hypothetical protein